MSIVVSTKAKLILCLDKPSHLRTSDDLDVIYNCLKVIKAYSGLHPYLLQQMCMQVQYENLKERIVVYQGGKPEKNCYVVMSGSLIVVDKDNVPDILNRNYKLQESKIYPLINEGCAFGNNFPSDLNNRSKSFSINLLDSKAVVTQDDCELLYMDQKIFQEIWSKNEKFLRDLNLSRDISAMDTNFSATTTDGNNVYQLNEDFNCHNLSVPTKVISRGCNATIKNAAYFVYKSSKPLLVSLPTKSGPKSSSSSTQVMIGEDMVAWMRQLIKINSRLLATGIWQVLLEHGLLVSLTSPHCLRDSPNDFYSFVDDFSPTSSGGPRSPNQSCDDLETAVCFLMKLAPDSLFRMILHKHGKERTKEELEFIYGELLHIKALSHLSSMVKRQLATLLMYEIHPHKDKVLFSQGSEGTSWYIIVKGSVDVHIKGKGVVCRLRENDDFGKLALVNNSPRAATIILRDSDCHFIKIDKDDFNRILRDVEVNTVRLTEHGKDVLLFERRSMESPNQKMSLMNPTAYSVIAGTPEKLIDHLLENRIDLSRSYAAILDRVVSLPDPMLETFFLTYFAFLTSHGLCSLLLVYFQNFVDLTANDGRATPIEDKEHDHVVRVRKTRVVHFLYWWCRISDGGFFEDHVILGFIETLLNSFSAERQTTSTAVATAITTTSTFNKEYLALNCLLEQFQKSEIASSKKISQRSRFSKHQGSTKTGNSLTNQQLVEITPIKAKDLTKFLVHFSNSTNCMLRLPVDTTVKQIIDTVSKHQKSSDDKFTLCEIKSDWEKIIFDPDDVGVMYSLSVNGRIYLLSNDEFKEFIPTDLSNNPSKSDPVNVLESASIDELAFHLTFLDWQLFKNIHVYELLFKVLGRSKFGRITANLDSFIRQFTSIQYWVATEICQCSNLQKRVSIVKKMIKLADRLSELKNISSSFAVLMGLNNSAVARLQATWDRVASKHKKLFHDLCSLLDPTRNHCAFRQYLKKTPPPIIPFVAIMLKDLTFINEANKTYFDECMINFEKMQLFASTLHQFLHCRTRPMIFENTTSLKKDKPSTMDIQNFVRNLKCVDDQKMLTSNSMMLEAKHCGNNLASVTFTVDN